VKNVLCDVRQTAQVRTNFVCAATPMSGEPRRREKVGMKMLLVHCSLQSCGRTTWVAGRGRYIWWLESKTVPLYGFSMLKSWGVMFWAN